MTPVTRQADAERPGPDDGVGLRPVTDRETARLSLTAHLHTLTAEQITELLTRRRDATYAPAPQDLSRLAERLVQPNSLGAAIVLLTLPQLQLVEAVAALADGCTIQRLAALIGVPENDLDLAAALTELAALALVWPHAGGLAGQHLNVIWQHPLGLGTGARELLGARTLPDLHGLAATLGISAGRSKAGVVSAIADWQADGAKVRQLAAQAPAETRAALDKLAWRSTWAPFGVPGVFLGPAPTPLPWAVQHGLVVPSNWQPSVSEMPREVALALRGDTFHAPFETQPPTLDSTPVPVGVVAREAAAAATITVAALTAVIETMSRTPVTLLKTGGMGVRELRRLAKATGLTEDRTRLAVELATASNLVAMSDDGIAPTAAYDKFTAAEPATRLLNTIETWLAMPACPSPRPSPANRPSTGTRAKS